MITISCSLLDALKGALEGKDKAHAAYREWHNEYYALLGAGGLTPDELKRIHHKEAGLRSNIGYCEDEIIKWAREIVNSVGV